MKFASRSAKSNLNGSNSLSTLSHSGGQCSRCSARYHMKPGVSTRTMSKATHSSVVFIPFFKHNSPAEASIKVKYPLSDESEAKHGKTLTHHSEGATMSLLRQLFFLQEHSKLARFSGRRGIQSPLSIMRCLAWVFTTIKITILSTLFFLVFDPLPSLFLEDKGLCVQKGVLKPYAQTWSLMYVYLKIN